MRNVYGEYLGVFGTNVYVTLTNVSNHTQSIEWNTHVRHPICIVQIDKTDLKQNCKWKTNGKKP